MRRSQSAQVIYAGSDQFRQIALTFDTEFQSETTLRLLDVLDAHQARSTFFLVGGEVDAYADMTRRIAATHEIGNHTQDHLDLTQLSSSGVRAQIRLADQAITAEVGRTPRPWFRPPFGYFNSTVVRVCGEEGYDFLVHWSVAPDETSTVEVEVRELLRQVFPGGIALFHGWTRNTPSALDQALPELRRRGYQFVTVSEILSIGRHLRDWGGTPIHVQAGDTLAYLGAAYNTLPSFLAAYNGLTGEPSPGAILLTPHRDEVIVRIDGVRLDFPVYPRIVGSHTIAPVRRVCEHLGAAVTWLASTRQVRVDRPGMQLLFTIGSEVAMVNGAPATMPVPAVILADTALVPLRFLAETLGLAVVWDGATRTVFLR